MAILLMDMWVSEAPAACDMLQLGRQVLKAGTVSCNTHICMRTCSAGLASHYTPPIWVAQAVPSIHFMAAIKLGKPVPY